jgi:AraC-like DNA-binding protein
MLLFGVNNNYGPSVSWFIDTYNVYSDIPRWASITYYCWLSVRVIRKSEINVQIDQHNEHISWLRQFLYLFIIFQVWWFIYLVPYVIPKFTDWMLDNVGWYPIYVPLALLIYTLGTKGYIQVRQIRKINQRPVPLPYDEQQVAEIIAKLKSTMEIQKLYLDPALNLSSLSSLTNIPAKQISTVLNQHLQKSFNEFVNEYRVSEVVRRLSNQEAEKWTIAGIAYESGFNSQPTFQRSFKSLTGKTPSQYLASLQSVG